ncbi:acyl carrier protein [Pseudonocardia endophytica]|uniref:Act minimal PKS acyl carrier protein n=1 Tax=Pseudonocardia endophytica TaxID=401976 RepID=A0A4V2PHV2_PSEEN|nr:acyl carrier protein [Pseudonocardia endophytica]TCK22206.1 act minimal PKS acyl carrier protein [Pseudonocardia endophytica]
MDTFTLEDLKTYLREAVGDDDSVDLDGDIVDVPFAELGFDSLAVIDTTSKIERRYGVALPEDAAAAAETPGELLELVTSQIAAAA